jgi:hypothetical protein
MLGIKPKASHMSDNYSTTQLHYQPHVICSHCSFSLFRILLLHLHFQMPAYSKALPKSQLLYLSLHGYITPYLIYTLLMTYT